MGGRLPSPRLSYPLYDQSCDPDNPYGNY